MSDSPNPTSNRPYYRAGIIGALVGILAIILFLFLWLLLSDVETLPRLVIAVCVPPGVMTVIIGGYIMNTQAKKSKNY